MDYLIDWAWFIEPVLLLMWDVGRAGTRITEALLYDENLTKLSDNLKRIILESR